MKCPICDNDYLGNVKRKGVVFRKKRFPELKGDMWICKKCYRSQTEISLVIKLKGLDPEKIYGSPIYPEREIYSKLFSSSEKRREIELERERQAQERLDEVWKPIIAGLFSIIGTFAIFGGIILLGWQTYTWLRSGTWVTIPLNYVPNKFLKGTELLLWITNPKSWYGLNNIVNYVLKFSVTSVLIVGGMLLVVLPVGFWMFLGSMGLIIGIISILY